MDEIKSTQGKVIGRIQQSETGQNIYDSTGKRLGSYNSKTGETKDAAGLVVSRGTSTLAKLLK